MHTLLQKIQSIAEKDKDFENRKIAEFLLENFRNINNLNITIIAKDCDVSPTKITRFSEKLNLKGFSELKLRLSDIANTVIIDGKMVSVHESIAEKKESFFDDYFEVLEKSSRNQFLYLNSLNVERISKIFVKASNIYLFAFNLSHNVSKNFVQRLSWLGIRIITENDPISIETYMNLISAKDMVILLTISGKNELILDIANRLKKQAFILGIGDQVCTYKNQFDYYINLISTEDKLWNINSIKAQLLMQTLDYIYAKLIIIKSESK